MKSFFSCVVTGVLAAFLSLAPFSVQSATPSNEPIDPAGVQLEPQQQNGIAYLSGGIGLDESRAIQQAKGYNLHMTFSTGPENKYVPDVDLVIQNLQGQSVLSLDQVGPIVYVQLPAGKYQVAATRNGHTQRSTVDMKVAGIRDLNLHWNDGY
ncbi:carboxypeptidase regulatory-like domain-containing protein [Pseudomonas chlororaphis]|uniref:carboxypeptidase regulatory-like domain-containing protein n=1 Tax=Pseudomonas chlororaphis TaxID=587753 RepID=UPI0015DF9350|nr:carboxypeptidase regulatory-like domain-containing protein [Pseudomonas chlororaphis]QLL13849.1 carboxypeptidase regulatory-like domain-containing protein [Pseudomonas chlororaphis subsp. aurantiaca]